MGLSLIRAPLPHERRTPERLHAHYAIERVLADRLRMADKDDRKRLYPQVYDELFRSVPDHPQNTVQRDTPGRRSMAASAAGKLDRFVSANSTFLELGSGDLALALEIARRAARVYAVDVSVEIMMGRDIPDNMTRVLSDGSSVPVPTESVDLAYSNQLMEHLHPDDALDQLRNILRSLKPAGRYVCLTPNRISGPHDVSMYFTDEPTGLHLKEYTTTELVDLFTAAGFSRVEILVPLGRRFVVLPAALAMAVEAVLRIVPRNVARRLARSRVVRAPLGRVIATKDASTAGVPDRMRSAFDGRAAGDR